MPLDETPYREKDFCQHYSLAERAGITWDSPGVPSHFPGIEEISNRALGLKPPVYLAGEKKMLSAAEAPKALPALPVSPEQAKTNQERVKALAVMIGKEAVA